MFADSVAPPVMKGNLLDLEFTMDMDHRKRRRNRTTQSCLNCHTSKRKCDRKRPCQRCIQLGLTGLCVYEVDDPALRDDPDIDEITRLRNRIAELESLVRELRGKPHPRWADPQNCDGDSSDRWHTRSQKRNSITKRRRQSLDEPDGNDLGGLSNIAVKVENVPDASQPCYYRLSPSPPPPPTYSNGFHPNNNGYLHSHANTYSTTTYDSAISENDSPLTHSPSSSSNSVPSYTNGIPAVQQGGQNIYRYSDNQHSDIKITNLRSLAPMNNTPYDNYHRYNDSPPTPTNNCTCVANAQLAQTFINLSRQLQGTVQYLQHLPEHSSSQVFTCNVYKRIYELNHILHGGEIYHNAKTASSYGNGFEPQPPHLRSPAESGLMTPLSVASHPNSMSAPTTPHTIQPGPLRHWDSAHNGSASFNPYFPQVHSSAGPEAYD